MQNAAFRFGLVAVFIILIGPVSAAEKHRNKQHAADPNHAAERQQAAPEQVRIAPLTWQTPWPAFVAEEQSTASGDNQNASEKPKNREEPGDLTVELTKRSTIAAEIQAHYAWRQFQIGIGAAIVSALAAAFTGWAAWAAADAARAARDAAEATKAQASIAKATMEGERRPYIFISASMKHRMANSGGHALIDYTVSNYGKAPAIIQETRVGSKIIDLGLDEVEDFMPSFVGDEGLYLERIIGPGISKSFTHRLTTWVDEGNDGYECDIKFSADEINGGTVLHVRPGEEIVFRVIVYYRGPFTDDHVTSACWRYIDSMSAFWVDGQNTNYQK